MKKIDLACIIDDDPVFVFGAKKIMELGNICKSFMVFHNGADALSSLKSIISTREKLPDFILLDINMPIMNGWEFLDEFIKIPSHKTITIYIATSSLDPLDSHKAASYSDVKNYLIKPINIEQLRQKLLEQD
ncbi:response regulator [Christiangramia sediminis]|uniref:Response regulator n=1 Tax=Christiangramia sediminis TaxID=2881336 RepID=A0A9X1RU85_9FLAO|nr:response regulator [Christiangramia sediminis]MCB7480468.1 response regulator [Christiangramia sediminis]